MPKDDPFYYVKTNDINSLKRLYSENKYIIAQKDNKGRTLLHYSVMENNYDITLFLLEQGINFNEPDNDGPHLKTPLKYSYNDQITELLKRFGAKFTLYNNPSLNFNSKGIDIKSNSNNIINDLYKQFLERGIISQKEELKLSNGEIIAKRLLRNNKYKQERDTSSWIKVYHGTKLVSIEHILILGLRSFGEPL